MGSFSNFELQQETFIYCYFGYTLRYSSIFPFLKSWNSFSMILCNVHTGLNIGINTLKFLGTLGRWFVGGDFVVVVVDFKYSKLLGFMVTGTAIGVNITGTWCTRDGLWPEMWKK